VELHDRFWASRGVQVVRLGQPSVIVRDAEVLMLAHPASLYIFRLAPILDAISWINPDLVFIRLSDRRRGEYAERIATDPAGRFMGFSRLYDGANARLHRVALTTDPEIARVWQGSPDPRSGWRNLRRLVPRDDRYAARLDAKIFDSSQAEEQALFMRELIRRWSRPDSTIDGIQRVREGIWCFGPRPAPVNAQARSPLWVGAGRAIPADAAAVGPAVLWDDPAARPAPRPVEWQQIEPLSAPVKPAPDHHRARPRPLKRLFDILFALLALAATLPLYPFIALAIFLEDRGPIFFGHTRETLGGREFKCWKFRSMRRDAEQIKARLAGQNQADGPQFFMENDPRLTRVGKVLRDLQLDEIPQFINVLKGDMSVVGPRPSPFKENQYCPPWREARLSVRPGVTGLWQISRTRAAGADFQEWIKYDIEYVERQSFRLDLWIIYKTVVLVLRKVKS
jgi:lipopolysaccharide/colanic/teichoic acid biosynthesis glycosyltransferase